jgi:hypothetical protein
MATTRLRGGRTTDDPRLGRVEPRDFRHVERYPLRALPTAERPTLVPVGIGVNWYEAFYPEKLIQRKNARGQLEWWVREGDLGRMVGGHALVLEPFASASATLRDNVEWWRWHNQVSEGICVSEMAVRLMALLNRKRYQPRPIYDWAQLHDYWAGEDYSGTSVDAGLACLRLNGAIPRKPREPHYIRKGEVTRDFVASEGISANRWATSIDEVFAVLGNPNAQSAAWLNSWGEDGYPWRVRVPRSVLARLHDENGEIGIVTDR